MFLRIPLEEGDILIDPTTIGFFKNSAACSWFLINNNSEDIVVNMQPDAGPTSHCSVSFKRISQ